MTSMAMSLVSISLKSSRPHSQPIAVGGECIHGTAKTADVQNLKKKEKKCQEVVGGRGVR